MLGWAWAVVFVGMLLTLLVVFIRRLARNGDGGGRGIAIGVVIGLAVAGLATVLAIHR